MRVASFIVLAGSLVAGLSAAGGLAAANASGWPVQHRVLAALLLFLSMALAWVAGDLSRKEDK